MFFLPPAPLLWGPLLLPLLCSPPKSSPKTSSASHRPTRLRRQKEGSEHRNQTEGPHVSTHMAAQVRARHGTGRSHPKRGSARLAAAYPKNHGVRGNKGESNLFFLPEVPHITGQGKLMACSLRLPPRRARPWPHLLLQMWPDVRVILPGTCVCACCALCQRTQRQLQV